MEVVTNTTVVLNLVMSIKMELPIAIHSQIAMGEDEYNKNCSISWCWVRNVEWKEL